METVLMTSRAHAAASPILAQHRLLLGYLDDIYRGLVAGDGEAALDALLEKASSCCRLHFLNEASIFEQLGVKEPERLSADHLTFVAHLDRFMGSIARSTVTRNVEEILFLKELLLEHIRNSEQRCGAGRADHPGKKELFS